MKISKEGLGTIGGLIFFTSLMLVLGITLNSGGLVIFSALLGIIMVVVIYFFRDPDRILPSDPSVIISPADGKVIEIKEMNENDFFDGRVNRISIYLNLFDVHVNYIPFDGVVDFMDYHRGKFFKANTIQASTHNVSTFVGFETSFGKMAVKQLTGMVARRIVTRLKLGQQAKKGDRFGIIKFGSRVEVFLPTHINITINEGDRVVAGESVIAKVDEK